MSRWPAILLLALLPLVAGAQDYDEVLERNFWNSGRNVAGLRKDSLSVSFAELRGEYTAGGFRESYEAKNSFSAGATAASIKHLERVSMNGSFSFRHFEGRQMTGSMSARPGYYPIDVLEFTPGRKTRQTYSFMGGIAADLSEHWMVGGSIDFTSENYTKRKDLRHTNYLLDLTVVPSVLWHSGDWSVGLSYFFQKTSERITAEELGITSGVYYAFLNKGHYYGSYDIWDNSSTHLDDSAVSGFPTKEVTNGAAAQLQWRELYADVEYGHSEGESGEKQRIWYRFPGDHIAASAGWKLASDRFTHYLSGSFLWRKQKNREAVLENVTENGVTTTVDYGSNTIFMREFTAFSLQWKATGERLRMTAGAEWDTEKEVSSIQFPYLYTHKSHEMTIFAAAGLELGSWEIEMGLCWEKGFTKDDSRSADEEIEAGDEPYLLEEYHEMEEEYCRAAKYELEFSLKYNFSHGIYIGADLRGTLAVGSIKWLPGRSRLTSGIFVGYNF